VLSESLCTLHSSQAAACSHAYANCGSVFDTLLSEGHRHNIIYFCNGKITEGDEDMKGRKGMKEEHTRRIISGFSTSNIVITQPG
jgi:hypothetical protein